MIKSDSGGVLLAIHHIVKEACNKNVRTGNAYSPASHGVVERVQQTFADQVMLKMSRLSSNSWAHILDEAVAAVQFATGARGVSPYELVFGSRPSLGLQPTKDADVEEWYWTITSEQVNQVSRKIKSAISRFNSKNTKQQFQIGNVVRVMNVQLKGS